METISVLIKTESYLFMKVSPAGPLVGKTGLAESWSFSGTRKEGIFISHQMFNNSGDCRIWLALLSIGLK